MREREREREREIYTHTHTHTGNILCKFYNLEKKKDGKLKKIVHIPVVFPLSNTI